jgi:peptide-methionine (S)-S-oxide reductase
MSSVSYHNEEQRLLIEETKEIEESKWHQKIVTGVIPFSEFYLAEDYHQKHALLHHHDFLSEFRIMYPLFADIVSSTSAARVNGYLGGYGKPADLRVEVDSYGLSQETGQELLDIVVSSHRHHCIRSGPC